MVDFNIPLDLLKWVVVPFGVKILNVEFFVRLDANDLPVKFETFEKLDHTEWWPLKSPAKIEFCPKLLK